EDFGRHTMGKLTLVLALSVFSCSGFPEYDYELGVMQEALNTSIARINAQSWWPNLYGVVRSHIINVYMENSNNYRLDLQLTIHETVCTKDSGRDPFTCDFKIGPSVLSAICRSAVEVSSEQIVNVAVQCHQGTFSSESISSEEMIYMQISNPSTRGNRRRDAFSSMGRSSRHGDGQKPDSINTGKME
ncbi:SPP24 protein, partial [Penelope pileata]|nr:SPP24 protein [Penelope pileata]